MIFQHENRNLVSPRCRIIFPIYLFPLFVMCRPRLHYHISTIFYTNIESYSTEQLQFRLYITVLTLYLSSSSLFLHVSNLSTFLKVTLEFK